MGPLTVGRERLSEGMATLMIELPAQADRTAFNLRRWAEVVDDPEFAKIQGRIETDRHGNILINPPPAASHSRFETRIVKLLGELLPEGESMAECPISTADGVRAADAAWASAERMAELGNRACFTRAPEICAEVLSPSNSPAEIQEKMALYFDAGALEVWTCGLAGEMSFFGLGSARLEQSLLCPEFPAKLELP